ncbi:autotransporter outer membrane beta-barrel domain-containing protein [Variovorax sp. J22P168]|uniref:autotransporter-associated beta strand repeat-containing protein n=1 Tax=Variovorax jilinensis TaxID=3053513 RepID=UPI0025772898|nr:autotransporter-associated beta strand repeat-containing protein [Variovorax sp. J22P168]MDM0015762.1 autotransporter outer membrane beta-barrel domain-containing protein [Variovorax sp. J22P168]
MNATYRVVWSAVRQAFRVTSELTRGFCKSTSAVVFGGGTQHAAMWPMSLASALLTMAVPGNAYAQQAQDVYIVHGTSTSTTNTITDGQINAQLGIDGVTLRAGSSIGDAADVSVSSGSTSALTFESKGVNLVGTYNVGGGIVFASTGASSVTGTLSGAGSLTVLKGSVTLGSDGAFSYIGSTTVAGGATLRLSSPSDASPIRSREFNVNGPSTFIIDAVSREDISGRITFDSTGGGVVDFTGEDFRGGTVLVDPLTITTTGGPENKVVSTSGVGLNLNFRPLTLETLDPGDSLLVSSKLWNSSGPLTKTGPGTAVLTFDNTYEGPTIIKEGSLSVSKIANGRVASNIGKSSNEAANLVLDGGTLRYMGAAGSTDRLFSVGTGGGTIDVSGDGALNFTNPGAMAFNGQTGARILTLGGSNTGANMLAAVIGEIGGGTSLVKSGTGTWVLTGNEGYTGGTTIDTGTLQIGNGGTSGSIIGNVTNNGALAFNRSDALIFSGVVSGTGTLTQAGPGVLTLTGANSYTGTTHIDNGVLSVATDANLGEPAAPVTFGGSTANGGVLQLTQSFNSDRALTLNTTGTIDIGTNNATFTAGIRGPGRLIKLGTGTLILTGGNTFNGTTTISGGTVEVGGGGSSGTVAGDIHNDGAMVYSRSDSRTYGGVISGTGPLTQAGGGVLTLSGASIYTGLTSVNSGVLALNGTVGGNAQVNNGATLRGTGTVAGQSNVADGGHLAPGNSAGTFSLGSLVLHPSSQLDYELGLPGLVGGSVNDLTQVAGNLTLDGTLNLANLGGMAPGVYRLINYGGVLTNNGLAVGSVPARFVSSDFLVDTATPGQVNLIVQSGGYALQFWDGANTTSNNAVDGGTGTWHTTPANWTGSTGNVNAPWQSGFAVFQGAAGTVTLGESIAFEGMEFRTGGYTIDGGGFALAGEPATIIRVDPLVTATINAPIVDGASGPARLIRSDAGLLVLGGANTYSGGTAINGGAVQVRGDNNLGLSSGGLSLNSGTLITSATFGSARNVDLGVDGGTFTPEVNTTLSLTGPISGPGLLTKLGAGTLVLTGANSYTGGNLVGNGVLAVASDANLGAPGGALDFAGGTLRFDADLSLATTRAVALNAGGGRIDTNGHNATIAQSIGGRGGLAKLGNGTLVLAGNNYYEGGTVISAGTLQLGNGGTMGSILGDVFNNGALVFSHSDALTYEGVISGSGTVTQSGTNTLKLTGDSTFTGTTTISSGTLQLGDGGSSGSVGGNITNNGTLSFNRSNVYFFGGAISGGGGVSQVGTGTTVLSGANTYAGATTVTAGTLRAGAANTFSAASAHTVANGATLDTGGFNQRVAALVNSGTVSLLGATAGSTLTVSGPYAAHSVLRLGTQLGGVGSVSDRLVLDGPGATASGKTSIQVTNLGGLGALTTGNGIEVVSGINGATTTAQTTKSAFTLANGHVDAGAYEYRLYAADAQGAGENWYLRSTAPELPTVGQPVQVPAFRAEVPLLAALPAQLRQADLAMLGNLHRRIGDEAPAFHALDPQTGTQSGARRAWGRLVYSDLDIQQPGVAQAHTEGRVSGLQGGTDLWAGGEWRAGVYVGYVDGGVDVSGHARGITATVGRNELQSRYLGAYATWMQASGLYVDSVLQGGNQRFTVRPDINPSVSGKASSFTASVEAGMPFALSERWSLEPQAQVAWQHSSVDDMVLSGAQVSHDNADGWIGRLGVRIKGDLATGAGRLQPYARANLYWAHFGDDVVRFIGPAGSLAIASGGGYSAAEVAAGATLALSPATSLYGELGHLWSIGGDATVKFSVQASLGIKVRW